MSHAARREPCPIPAVTTPANHVMPRLYHVHTTAGAIELWAVTAAQAVATALELAGPGARILRICRAGDW
jgi:hypothetical protein